MRHRVGMSLLAVSDIAAVGLAASGCEAMDVTRIAIGIGWLIITAIIVNNPMP